MRLTPVRQLLDALDIKQALGKRRHEDLQVDSVEQRTPPRRFNKNPASQSQRNACMALQHEDLSEDAIVITTLDSVPFCCHEDLITMPRAQLLAVANSLNSKLPRTLKIDISPAHSDREIRKGIEFARSNPLGNKGKLFGLYTPSPGLDRLDEADEEEDSPKLHKRRKVSTKTVFDYDNDDVFKSPSIGGNVLESPLQFYAAEFKLREPAGRAKTAPLRTLWAQNLNQPRTLGAECKRKDDQREVHTSSYLFAENSFSTPQGTSTPHRRNGDHGSASPYRSLMGSMTDIAEDGSTSVREGMLGLYGQMCESYDGDFVDMDASPA